MLPKYHESAFNLVFVNVCAQLPHSGLTLCDPMDCSLPVFSVHGIFQARILEWVAMLFSRQFFPQILSNIRATKDLSKIMCLHVILNLGGYFELNFLLFLSMLYLHTLIGMISSVKCFAQSFSCVRLFVTSWIRAHQAPLSMGILQAKILE